MQYPIALAVPSTEFRMYPQISRMSNVIPPKTFKQFSLFVTPILRELPLFSQSWSILSNRFQRKSAGLGWYWMWVYVYLVSLAFSKIINSLHIGSQALRLLAAMFCLFVFDQTHSLKYVAGSSFTWRLLLLATHSTDMSKWTTEAPKLRTCPTKCVKSMQWCFYTKIHPYIHTRYIAQ